MSAHYDTYDYPSYWVGREYEHGAEMFALDCFLKRIPKIKTVVEIGAGYGRLVPSYIFRAERIILSDPSSKLLKIARSKFKNKRISFIHSGIENIYPKIKRNTADLIVLVRVLHHIQDLDTTIATVNKISKQGAFLILEFANKRHLKAMIFEFLHGNFTFPLDIFPKEIKNARKRKKTIPFFNYHPDIIKEKLQQNGYIIVEVRSVSNIRSSIMKRVFSNESLLFLEKMLQKILAYVSFGPSIFILAKKKFINNYKLPRV